MKHLIKIYLLVISMSVLTPVNAQLPNTVLDIAWNADGTLIAVSIPNRVEVRSALTNEIVWSSITTNYTTHLDWHPTNVTEIAYVPQDSSITIVDVVNNTQLLQIPVQGYTNSIIYDPSGSRLLTSHTNGVTGPGQRGYIRVFDRASGQETIMYEESNARYVGSAKWDNTGQRILALGSGVLVIWDATSGQIIQTISELETATDELGDYEVGQMSAFDVNPVNNDLAIAESIFVSFWDAPMYSVKRLESLIFGSVNLEWSADGQFVATATGPDRIINIIDPVTGEVMNTINTFSNVEAIAWNPITSELAIGETTPTGEISIIINPITSCNTTTSISHMSALFSAITTGNNARSPYTICLEVSTYTLSPNALPIITGDITIISNGATITSDTSALDVRIFRVADGAILTLENLTLNGHDPIDTSGTVRLMAVTLVGDSGGE